MQWPWGQGDSIPGARDTPSLGSGTLHPWVRDALCDREPNSGHQACARAAGHQPAPLLLALTPRPSPRFTWEQPQAPRDTSCHPTQGILHPPGPTGTEGRATMEQTKPKRLPQPPPAINTHLFNQPFPGFNIISRQPANQRQLPRITVNGSLFSWLLLNRYRN